MEKFTYQQMHQDEKGFWWYTARRKILRSVLRQYQQEHSSILEIGSGTGGNVSMLSEFGAYLGLEKEPLALQLARENHPDQSFKCLSVPEELDQVRGQFDLVAMLDVIEHIEDDLNSLKQVSPLLKPGGHMLITTPAFPSLWSAHDEVHHHFRRYTKKQLLALCKQAGYQVEYHTFFNFFLAPVAVIVKLANKLRRSKQPHRTSISGFLNRFLAGVFGLEAKWIPKHKFPFGISHLVVLTKQQG